DNRAASLETKLEWMENGVKVITGPLTAIRFDEINQRKTWFNNLAICKTCPMNGKVDDHDTYVELGNGDLVPDDAKEYILRIMEEECVVIPWKKGDCDGLGYDWSDQAEEGPTNFALMAYNSLGSSSPSSSDSEVSTCSKACLKSYETLKEHYDNLTKDFNKSQINVGAYKAGVESVEAGLDVLERNLKKLKKRDDLKLTLEKFENSSKNLSKLLEIQVSDKFKTGVGFDSQVFDSQVFDSKVNDKHKSGKGYHAVPPPYTGNFMPPKPDLVLADGEEYVFSTSITSVPSIATSEAKTSESKPKSVSEPLI
ncbi:hypothetical protein Tco_0716476, partial [Tanacetum coccineum]